MFCPNCGIQLGAGVNFCPNCGSRVSVVNTAATAAAQGDMVMLVSLGTCARTTAAALLRASLLNSSPLIFLTIFSFLLLS